MKQRANLLLLLLCLSFWAAAQRELTDRKHIVYASNVKDWQGNVLKELALDIYYPTGASAAKTYPAVLFLHGGSFIGGNRNNVADGCDQFANGGFICIAIDYRTGYQQSTEAGKCHDDTTEIKKAIYRAMQDANAAWRFIAANATKYNIDTSALFVAGASAGAELAYYDSYVNDSVANILFTGFGNTLGMLQTSGNRLPANYTIKGICGMWGGVPAMPDNADLINTTYRAYPTILFKGGKDKGLTDGYGYFAGCANYPRNMSGMAIYNRLRALQVPCVYHFQPLSGHEAYDDVFCINQSLCFFTSIINQKPYSGYFTYYNPSCK